MRAAPVSVFGKTARDGVLIDDCTDALWAVAAGTGTVTVDTTDPLERRRLLFAATVAGGFVQFSRDIAVSLKKGQGLCIRLRRDATLSAINWSIYTGNTGSPKIYTTNDGVSAIPVGEWFDHVIPPAYFSQPASPLASHFERVHQIRLQVTPTGGNVSTLEVASIRAVGGEDTTGRVIWQFDDGRDDTYARAFPTLTAAGMIGNIPVEYGAVGGASRMTLAQLQEVYAAGWSINGHHTAAMGGLSDAANLVIFKAAKNFMRDNGLVRGSDHWVWPGGSRSIAAFKIGRRLYRTFRPTSSMCTYAVRHAVDPYDVPVQYFTHAGKSLAAAKLVIDRLRDFGGTAVFVFHSLTDTLVAAEDWLYTDFQELVTYAVAQGIKSTDYDDTFGDLTPANPFGVASA